MKFPRRIRQNTNLKALLVIMLTAKGEEFDRVLGLELELMIT